MNHDDFLNELNEIWKRRRTQPEIDESRFNLIEQAIIDILLEKKQKGEKSS